MLFIPINMHSIRLWKNQKKDGYTENVEKEKEIMGQRIAINTSVLERDTSEIESLIDKLNSISNAVYEDVEQLHSMWEGTAHAVLVLQFAKDYEYVKDTILWLRNFREELEYAKKEYNKAELDVSNLIQQLK